MARRAILQEVGCPVLPHEQLQLLIQYLVIPHPIHHFPLLQPLQGAPPLPAEAAPNHQLGRVLDGLPGEPGVQPVRARQLPVQTGPVPKGQLEMAFITEHDLFLALHFPVPVALAESNPLVLHGLGEEGLEHHLPGRQLQLCQADPLDGPDAGWGSSAGASSCSGRRSP